MLCGILRRVLEEEQRPSSTNEKEAGEEKAEACEADPPNTGKFVNGQHGLRGLQCLPSRFFYKKTNELTGLALRELIGRRRTFPAQQGQRSPTRLRTSLAPEAIARWPDRALLANHISTHSSTLSDHSPSPHHPPQHLSQPPLFPPHQLPQPVSRLSRPPPTPRRNHQKPLRHLSQLQLFQIWEVRDERRRRVRDESDVGEIAQRGGFLWGSQRRSGGREEEGGRG